MSLSNTKIIFREGDINLLRLALWRFETIDNPNVEINLSRDYKLELKIII